MELFALTRRFPTEDRLLRCTAHNKTPNVIANEVKQSSDYRPIRFRLDCHAARKITGRLAMTANGYSSFDDAWRHRKRNNQTVFCHEQCNEAI